MRMSSLSIPFSVLTGCMLLAQVTFRNPYHYRHDKELFIAAEGVYSGQVCEIVDITSRR